MTGEEADQLLGSEEDMPSDDEGGGKGGGEGGGGKSWDGGRAKKSAFLKADPGVRRKGPLAAAGAHSKTTAAADATATAAPAPAPAKATATPAPAKTTVAAAAVPAAAAGAATSGAASVDDVDDVDDLPDVPVKAASIGPTLRPNPWDIPEGGKRKLGPMMPPRALLEAAAMVGFRVDPGLNLRLL